MFTKVTPKIRVKDFATANISETIVRLGSNELRRIKGGAYFPKGSVRRPADV